MMMRIQSETNGRPQPTRQTVTSSSRDSLIEAKTTLVTAILAGQNCYVQGEDAALRYRLLSDTALQLAELNQVATYFDLSNLAYQYDLIDWMQNNLRLLAIQLNLPLPTTSWWAEHSEEDPITLFVQFLGEYVLSKKNKSILFSFDEADQLLQAPLAAHFWRLLDQIETVQAQTPESKQLTMVLWGKSSWQRLAGNGRSPTDTFKQIIL